MVHFYSDEDVNRWEHAYRQSAKVHVEKLATALPRQKMDFHLGMLALSYETQGMICIARGRFQEAIEAFRASVETTCKQYEQLGAGEGQSLDAGAFQSILIGCTTGDWALVLRLTGYYRAENGTPGSIFIGGALKLIVMGDLRAAADSLAKKRPRFGPELVGYAECLEAIVNKDLNSFAAAIDMASKSWARLASKRDRGLPNAVCFIYGVGLVRLASHVLGRQVMVSNEYVPQQLLE